MSTGLSPLVERLNRIVFDKGDIDLLIELDRIMDKETDSEQAAALGSVIKNMNQKNKASQEG
jgi:hypothetical protein